jgi:uncharacterized membrane protein YgdD (TMEM256/DUF423 family)
LVENKMNNFIKKTVTFSGILGFSGVILGALGAHNFHKALESSDMYQAWQVAVEFQLIHSVALLGLASLFGFESQLTDSPAFKPARSLYWAVYSWSIGVVLFSGSLYILALGGPHWIGPVTPLGGLALMGGWGCLAAFGLSGGGKDRR